MDSSCTWSRLEYEQLEINDQCGFGRDRVAVTAILAGQPRVVWLT